MPIPSNDILFSPTSPPAVPSDVIIKLFPGLVTDAPPNDDVATNVVILAASPTYVYPFAKDAVTDPDIITLLLNAVIPRVSITICRLLFE